MTNPLLHENRLCHRLYCNGPSVPADVSDAIVGANVSNFAGNPDVRERPGKTDDNTIKVYGDTPIPEQDGKYSYAVDVNKAVAKRINSALRVRGVEAEIR